MSAPIIIDMEQFIQDVMSHQEIWMSKHPHHKNKFKVKRCWDELGRKYPMVSVEDLKKRWKNLKDTYRKELKRLPQTKTGFPVDNVKSGYRYFDQLSFLRDEMCLSSQETKEEEIAIQPEVDNSYKIEVSSPAPATPGSSVEDEPIPAAAGGCQAAKRKDLNKVREEFLQIERKKMEILEAEIARSSQITKSDNYHFLMSLLPEMEKLSPIQKMRLRTKISQAVLEEVTMAMYGEQQSYVEVNTQQYHSQSRMDTVEVKEESINMYD